MLKVGIICAGDDELAPFLPHIENCKITKKAMLKFYEGKINHVTVVALFSGVCKVNAAIATQILIDCYHVNMVVNAGTCGAMTEKLHIFDTVISTEVAYHDVDEEILTEFHPWLKTVYFPADPMLLVRSKKVAAHIMAENKIVFGRMVTGEAFISEDGRTEINEKHSPLTVDMETGSIAHVCYVNGIPFIAIRTVTDTPVHTGLDQFDKNCEKASQIAKYITLSLLDEMHSNIISINS